MILALDAYTVEALAWVAALYLIAYGWIPIAILIVWRLARRR